MQENIIYLRQRIRTIAIFKDVISFNTLAHTNKTYYIQMKILKFGGSSICSANNIQKIGEIIKSQNDNIIVVISAFSGITDKIMTMARMAVVNNEYYNTEFKNICKIHESIINEIIAPNKQKEVNTTVDFMLSDLKLVVDGVSMINELTDKTISKICSFGERVSAYIISQFIEGSILYNSTHFIKTNNYFVNAQVNLEETNKLIIEGFRNFKGIGIVPGFIASNTNGDYTTLGKGGSDYSAAIFAAALNADELQLWTNVDGFMTADPHVISKAYIIDSLSYLEAMELSNFGAKVIYSPTILPVYKKNIPVNIKNILNPKANGTLICSTVVQKAKKQPIKGISSISNISLITIRGLGMIKIARVSTRLFNTLSNNNIDVLLISQASSENSISIAINTMSGSLAELVIKKEFESEILSELITSIDIENDLSVVAIVGENIKQSTRVAGKLFNTIGKSGINIRAISQDASELNISWVVKTSNLRKTLNIVHESFFLSENIELNVFLLGVGLVGGSLIKQIANQQEKLLKENHLDIKIVGIANSKNIVIDRDGIELENYKDKLYKSQLKSSLEAYKDEIINMNIYNSVLVDCTASSETPSIYYDLLDANISIVTANKVAASSSYKNYKKLKELASDKGVKFLFETNVGAGLPIINTINDMVNSGDKINKIEAVLSGTLNYIFNTISAEVPLSQTIKLAKEEGYAEPDPRIDLSGLDVMRKLLILARESGYKVEASDIVVTKFISDELFEGTIEKFWENISKLDANFEKERQRLVSQGKCWRFVAKFENERGELGLQEIDYSHPFYDLQGSNNLVMFSTQRYNEFPMIIKGYGAGAEVTAAGVFADIIRISNI